MFRSFRTEKWVYLGVKTYEVFLCFLAIIFLGSIVLTPQWLLCIHCFTSLLSLTGFYTGDEPEKLILDLTWKQTPPPISLILLTSNSIETGNVKFEISVRTI